MRRFFVIVAIMALVGRVFAAHIPAPTGFVNDFAGALNASDKQSIEDDLVSYKASSGNEIAVALITSLDGDTVEEVAVRTFEEWKIGEKDKDTGVLFLAAINDRKMRIEVGYGLEPLLTDGEAGEILRADVAPAFREEKYAEGVKRAVTSIKREFSGSVEEGPVAASKPFPIPWSILILFFIYLCAFMARSKSVWLGGVAGAVGGAGVGWWIGSVAAGAALTVFLALLGVLLDAILSRNYETLKSKGGKTGFFSSRGGFWSSGSGKSSGSFGGFSGGSSGGGGAGSSW
ncbi:TPM domain-containing protein [Candidatus Gottesmanbacteria bacterium]|nr:TPM domain-containing protein [Candidatus Gottesmanbacteria bacterium]